MRQQAVRRSKDNQKCSQGESRQISNFQKADILKYGILKFAFHQNLNDM